MPAGALALMVVAPVLVFGGAALVVVVCVPVVVVALVLVFLRSGSGCILCYFADLGKMGAHAHTRIYTHIHTHTRIRAIIFRPAIFRL